MKWARAKTRGIPSLGPTARGCKGESKLTETLCAFNITRKSFLGLQVCRADTPFARLRGLLGRKRLSSNEGLWMVPSQGVHTIGLMFPTDIVYLDADLTVIHMIEHVPPFRITPIKMKAQTVLELGIRSIHSSRTQIGDKLLICSPETLKARWQDVQRATVAQGART